MMITTTPTDPAVFFATEIVFKIFSYLDIVDLGTCSKVSRTWRNVAEDNFLWKPLAEKHYYLIQHCPQFTIAKGEDIKQSLNRYMVGSKKQLFRLIQEFFNEVSLNKNGRFTCFLPFQPYPEDSVQQIHITVREKVFTDHPEYKAAYIFRKKLGSSPLLVPPLENYKAKHCVRWTKYESPQRDTTYRTLKFEGHLWFPSSVKDEYHSLNSNLEKRIKNLLKRKLDELEPLRSTSFWQSPQSLLFTAIVTSGGSLLLYVKFFKNINT